MGRRAGLDEVAKRKIPRPCREFCLLRNVTQDLGVRAATNTVMNLRLL
jgi:hypothetical protein